MAEEGNIDTWRTPLLRQNVKTKIEEAIRNSGNPTSKTVAEMEAHIYMKAQTKEEYLSFVARLILHVKEMNSKKQSGIQQIVGQPSGIISGAGTVSSQSSDPMSALQNMAAPQPINDISSANVMHMSIGNVNDGVMVTGSAQSMPSNVPSNMNSNINMSQNMIPNLVNQNQMSHISNINQTVPQMTQQQQQHLRGSANIIMPTNRMISNINQVMVTNSNLSGHTTTRPQVLSSDLQLHLQKHRQPVATIANIPVKQEPKFFDNQQMTNQSMVTQPQFKSNAINTQQFQVNSPMMVSNQNQVMNPNLQPPQSMNQMPPTPQMMPSPSGYAPSASPMMPSPHSGIIRQTNPIGAPSPGNISLNTPANIMVASPGSVGQTRLINEDQIYLEKLRNLQKYVDPLRKTIERVGQDNRYSNDKKKELDKMKNLLNILTDSSRRCPMTTLEKCEQVLERMDFKFKSETAVATAMTTQTAPIGTTPAALTTTTTTTTTQASVPKIQDICQPLLDAILMHIKKPLFNHTLQRTFGPAVAALTNNYYSIPSPPPLKRKYEEEQEIPEVLQGEIARLDARFEVQLDPLHHNGSKTILLICKLDDKDLPCVPPLSIRVPECYPEKPPQCSTDPLEYSASAFFQDIQKIFDANINKLPEYFSVTSLLNSWELSVRQAVSASLI